MPAGSGRRWSTRWRLTDSNGVDSRRDPARGRNCRPRDPRGQVPALKNLLVKGELGGGGARVLVNCQRVVRSMRAGAFNGCERATSRRFELSHPNGSIFLDEISEVPAETQVMLLRVFARTRDSSGSAAVIRSTSTTRVIAASNRKFKNGVREEGRFREDLYYG